MGKKVKKVIYTLIQIALLAFIAYNLYQIGDYFYGRYKAQKNFDMTESIYQEIVVETETEEEMSEEELRALKDEKAKELIAKLRETNPDIYAYITVPGTRISYPVLYRDNDYYLRRDFNHEYSLPGSIFIEETNNPNFTDRNTTVYGHNMSQIANVASMFADLEKFMDSEFLNDGQEKTIEMQTTEGLKIYKIVSAYEVNAYDDYRSFDMDDESWVKYANTLIGNSDFDYKLGREITAQDKMITLSTCDNIYYDGRYTVHAILTDK